jgi:hypothetical protein
MAIYIDICCHFLQQYIVLVSPWISMVQLFYSNCFILFCFFRISWKIYGVGYKIYLTMDGNLKVVMVFS